MPTNTKKTYHFDNHHVHMYVCGSCRRRVVRQILSSFLQEMFNFITIIMTVLGSW